MHQTTTMQFFLVRCSYKTTADSMSVSLGDIYTLISFQLVKSTDQVSTTTTSGGRAGGSGSVMSMSGSVQACSTESLSRNIVIKIEMGDRTSGSVHARWGLSGGGRYSRNKQPNNGVM
jgi:hypothetical protein